MLRRPQMLRCATTALQTGCRQPVAVPARTNIMWASACRGLSTALSSLSLTRSVGRELPAAAATAATPASSIQCRTMTLNQKVRRKDPFIKIKKRTCDKKQAHYKGLVIKPVIVNPKKPNSGNRKAVRIRITAIGKEALAYIPGVGHTLVEHNIVLVRHGKVPDCPGLKYVCIRGKYDLKHVEKKKKK